MHQKKKNSHFSNKLFFLSTDLLLCSQSTLRCRVIIRFEINEEKRNNIKKKAQGRNQSNKIYDHELQRKRNFTFLQKFLEISQFFATVHTKLASL